jgi:hypothetical protein
MRLPMVRRLARDDLVEMEAEGSPFARDIPRTHR